MTEFIPCAEMARFANTGTEAVQLALRIARGATGRLVVIKFEGHYHGWMDSMWAGSPIRTGVRDAGRESGAASGMIRPPWSTRSSCPGTTSRRWKRDWRPGTWPRSSPASLPRLHRAGAGLPRGASRGHHTGRHRPDLRRVVSRFRAGPGGAQALLGVTPDLATFAKALANGYPIGAVAGRRDLLSRIGGGPVVHPGTYNGNALSTAAAAATLRELQEEAPTSRSSGPAAG